MGAPGAVEQPVILFDGVCNLCNSSVLFIIQRDPKATFRFASLQSAFGKQQLLKHHLPETSLNSVLLIRNGQVLQKSDAALEIARHLSGAWPLLAGFKIVPRVMRDWVYNWIARNRYNWFGKKDACMIPTPALQSRFVG